jgi:hypothetical protein
MIWRVSLTVQAVAAVLLTLSAPAASQTPAYDNLIIPGVRIGPVLLGDTPGKVEAMLGKPSKIGRGDYIVYTYRGTSCMEIYWTDKGLNPGAWKIIATCDRWQTTQGVRVGQAMPKAAAALGQPTYENCNSSYCHVGYDQQLYLQSDGRDRAVKYIIITKPPRS